MQILATITIGLDPALDIGPFTLSWHGFLTFISVALGVFLVVRWGAREGFSADGIYSVSVWCILGGIIGARLLHVIDFWEDIYQHDPVKALEIWRGGVTIYGAILGGFVSGALYILIRNANWYLGLLGRYCSFLGEPVEAPLPSVGRLADIAAPALLIAQAIGRIGDIINGEHCAKFSNLPWAVVYSHPERGSLACEQTFGIGPTHPAVAYELLMDLVILGLIWPLRNRLRPNGMFFALYLGSYSLGRFFLSFLRNEFNEYGGLNEAQIIALVIMAITIPMLIFKAKLVKPDLVSPANRHKVGTS